MSKITYATVIVATTVLMLAGCSAPVAEKFSPSETTLDEFFLMRVNSGWQAEERTSDQQLAAGMRACEQIKAGVPRDDVRALDETTVAAVHDNTVIVYYAAYILCPAI